MWTPIVGKVTEFSLLTYFIWDMWSAKHTGQWRWWSTLQSQREYCNHFFWFNSLYLIFPIPSFTNIKAQQTLKIDGNKNQVLWKYKFLDPPDILKSQISSITTPFYRLERCSVKLLGEKRLERGFANLMLNPLYYSVLQFSSACSVPYRVHSSSVCWTWCAKKRTAT